MIPSARSSSESHAVSDRLRRQIQILVGEGFVQERLAELVEDSGRLGHFGQCLRIRGVTEQRGFGELETRRTRQDPIEIGRESLGHHHGFAAAFGTADVVGTLDRAAVVVLDDRLGRLRDLIVGVVSEVAPGLGIEAERQRAVAVGIVVDGVVVAGIGRDHRESHLQRVGALLALQVAQRAAEIAVRSAAAFKEEAAVPIGGQTQMEPDGVVLRVHAGAFVHPALDLAMLGQCGRVALRSARRIQHGRVDHGGRVRQPGQGTQTRALGCKALADTRESRGKYE